MKAVLATLLLVASSAAAAADSVVLHDGRVVEGLVVEHSERRVVLETAGGRLGFDPELVAEVRRGSQASDVLLRLDHALASRRPERVATLLAAALREPAAREDAAARLVEQEPALRDPFAQTPPGARGPVLLAMRDVATALPDDAGALLAAARLMEALDSAPDVELVLRRLAASPAAGDLSPAGRRWAVERLLARARALTSGGRESEALELVEATTRLSAETPAAAVAALARSRAARDRGDHAAALAILAADVAPSFPAVAAARARAMLPELARATRRDGTHRLAFTALSTDAMTLAPAEARATLAGLAAEWAQGALAQGRARELLDALEEHPSLLGDPVIAREAERARLRIAIDDCPPGDAIRLFELAEQAANAGLVMEARGALEVLRRNPELREMADERLRLLARRDDQAALESALVAFDEGRVEEAWAAAARVSGNPDRASAAAPQAGDLAELARRELNMDLQAQPHEAEALYQEAQRALDLGDVEAAWNLLDTVLTQYGSTPAAQRADALLPLLAREFRLQQLEGAAPGAAAWRALATRMAPPEDQPAEGPRPIDAPEEPFGDGELAREVQLLQEYLEPQP